ncbi:MAG: hypothetical protein HW416_3082 [Chloroflexi bacterium]|nr:hypothetical protein [Chloroflexota bacterium]
MIDVRRRWCRGLSTALVVFVLAAGPASTQSEGARLAMDGQSLLDQDPETQAIFAEVWGDRAGEEWANEHDAELIRLAPPATVVPTASSTQPVPSGVPSATPPGPLAASPTSTATPAASPSPRPAVRTFDECARAGYPVTQSYPRQCVIPGGGGTFIEADRVCIMIYPPPPGCAVAVTPTAGAASSVVTLSDNHKTMTLFVGQTFTLDLGTSYVWTGLVTDPSILARVDAGPAAGRGVYQALGFGQTTLTARGDPPCYPLCLAPSILFEITIVVRPSG